MVNDSIFKTYLEKKNNIIRNRGILQNTYVPAQIIHRDTQVKEIVDIIAPSLNKDKPSNITVIGKTGTGKTAVLKYIGKELKRADLEMNNCDFLYINCETVDTPYSILYNISNHVVSDPSKGMPFTGWSLERAFQSLITHIDSANKVFIIVLDEIDQSYNRNGDDIFYFLTTINEMLVNSRVSIIGVTNNSKFHEILSPKIRSRLGEEKVIFPPYTPAELIDILQDRAKEAFYPDVVDESVIPYVAAISAQDSGDARKALDLLRISADIAERNGEKRITEAHVEYARQKFEIDASAEIVKSLTLQSKLVLLAIIKINENNVSPITTGEVFSVYSHFASNMSVQPLTQRRIGDLISELDMLGIITARIRSLGRNGRTKFIELNIPKQIVSLLTDDELFHGIYVSPNQKTLY